MSVCIAATYSDEVHKAMGVIGVCDTQVTDTHTSRASALRLKALFVGNHLSILGAGDITLFHSLVGDALRMMPDPHAVTVREFAGYYVEAERQWRQNYIERHVLTKFGLSWDTYQEKLVVGGWPDRFIDTVTTAIANTDVPYSTDAIVLGVDPKTRMPDIIRITPNGFDTCTEEGVAIIGEGDSVATAEFSNFTPYWSRGGAAYLCFLAKKRSEVISSVGEFTVMFMIDSVQGTVVFDPEIRESLEKEYKRLDKQRTEYEEKSYVRAKELIQNHIDKAGASKPPPEGASEGASA
jgi:hypothetical protein